MKKLLSAAIIGLTMLSASSGIKVNHLSLEDKPNLAVPVQKLFSSAEQLKRFGEANKWPDSYVQLFDKVNWSKEYLIVVATGEQRTGGNTVRVTAVTKSKDGLKVTLTSTFPSKGCPVTDAITYPADFVTIPRVNGIGKPKFVTISKEINCK